MVLQQNEFAGIWGWASPKETITITNTWNNDSLKTVTDGSAKWRLKIPAPPAGGPYTITISEYNTIVLHEVMIGEVWICSGQSNMEYSAALGMKDALEELPTAYNPLIKLFTVAKATAFEKQENCHGNWQICDSASLRNFSAVGYFFAKRLQQSLQVPVGIINISWSGTPAEVWLPEDSINKDAWLAEHAYSQRFPVNDGWPTLTGTAYNAMIAPATNFTIAGVIWYQGESNAGYPRTYHRIFGKIVQSWRTAWNKKLPFYYVQIAPFLNYGPQDTAALIREQQVACLQIPNTGMVVITDLVDDVRQIHPSYKKGVGDRLANWALTETYQQKNIVYKSPLYKKMEIINNAIRIHFDNASQGLIAKAGKITEFEIAGVDRHFIPADVRIDKNTISVYAKGIANPVAVRFAFSSGPVPNLFSKEGLPVSPFRTDKW